MKQDSCSVQNVTQIHANQVAIEITDLQSGNQFTRILPMEYFENAQWHPLNWRRSEWTDCGNGVSQ